MNPRSALRFVQESGDEFRRVTLGVSFCKGVSFSGRHGGRGTSFSYPTWVEVRDCVCAPGGPVGRGAQWHSASRFYSP